MLGAPTKTRPDLAIEVVWTSGGLDKLQTYRGLQVPEVWCCEPARINVHVLRHDRYQQVARSELLPELDLVELGSLVEHPDQAQAVRQYRALLRSRSPEG